MALNFLSIPPMSDAPERTFSCGRRIIPWTRAKLKARIEALRWSSHYPIGFHKASYRLIRAWKSEWRPSAILK